MTPFYVSGNARRRNAPATGGCQFLRETPAGLAERLALAEAEGRRGSNPIHQGITASDGVTETEEGALGRREMRIILRLVGIGDTSEFGLVADCGSLTLDYQIETRIEGRYSRS